MEVEEKDNVLPIILKSNISILKKIAAIVLLCFGVMTADESHAQKAKGKVKCETTTKGAMREILGKPALLEGDTTKSPQTIAVDTTSYQPQIMGMIKPYQPPKGKSVEKTTSPKKKK